MCIGEAFIFKTETRKIIVELNKICLNNVVTQYGDQLYIQKKQKKQKKNGIVTGYYRGCRVGGKTTDSI